LNVPLCRPLMISLVVFVLSAVLQTSQVPRDLTWEYAVVSTPDFTGPFRGEEPTFEPLVEISVSKPTKPPTNAQMAALLEAIVDAEGKTAVESTIGASSPEGEKVAREIINSWRFQPARLEGKPIRVRIRIQISQRP